MPKTKENPHTEHVHRVFKLDDCDELRPAWPDFVRDVVVSDELQFNIIHGMRQQHKILWDIGIRLGLQVLDYSSAAKQASPEHVRESRGI